MSHVKPDDVGDSQIFMHLLIVSRDEFFEFFVMTSLHSCLLFIKIMSTTKGSVMLPKLLLFVKITEMFNLEVIFWPFKFSSLPSQGTTFTHCVLSNINVWTGMDINFTFKKKKLKLIYCNSAWEYSQSAFTSQFAQTGHIPCIPTPFPSSDEVKLDAQ